MKDKDSKTIKIFFYGDSICFGQGVSINKGWALQLVNFLDEALVASETKVLVTNSSVNGRTTRQALEDMPYHVQSQNPDIVIIQYGLNDCNHWASDRGLPRVSQRSFEANLLEMVERATHFGAKFVLLNNNHPTSRFTENFPHTDKTYEDFNKKYNSITRAVAAELGGKVIFQDVENYFNNHLEENAGADISQYLLSDGLHLSEDGHRLYFDLIKPVLIRVVEQFARK